MFSIQRISLIGLFLLICQNETSAMCLRSKDISGGEDHTMVLTQDGSVFTCGLDKHSSINANYEGVLGLGNLQSDYVDTLSQVLEGAMQTDFGYLEDIIAISAGWTHSVALDEDGFTWSWGGNRYGQLGDNKKEFPYSNVPVQVLAGEQNPDYPEDPNLPLQNIVNIAAGRSGKHSLAVDKYGLTWSWGINTYGQLGCGDTVTRFVPVAVFAGEQNPTEDPNQLSHIVEVSGGAWHSLALEDPNQGANVYAFGINTSWGGDGILGVNQTYEDLPQTEKPVKVLSG